MTFTKDGGLKVGVKEMGAEEYADRTQRYVSLFSHAHVVGVAHIYPFELSVPALGVQELNYYPTESWSTPGTRPTPALHRDPIRLARTLAPAPGVTGTKHKMLAKQSERKRQSTSHNTPHTTPQICVLKPFWRIFGESCHHPSLHIPTETHLLRPCSDQTRIAAPYTSSLERLLSTSQRAIRRIGVIVRLIVGHQCAQMEPMRDMHVHTRGPQIRLRAVLVGLEIAETGKADSIQMYHDIMQRL